MRRCCLFVFAPWFAGLIAFAQTPQHVRDPHASFLDVPARRAELAAATDPRLLQVESELGSCVRATRSMPPPNPIVIPPHYLNGSHGAVNPEERRATLVYTRFERVVTDGANQYLLNANHAEAQCALDTLDRWAAGNALFDYHAPGSQAWFQAGWTLSGVSLAYSILDQDPALDLAEKSRVLAWFQRCAHKLIAAEPKDQRPVNLHDWRGLAATSIGILTRDDQLFNFGLDCFRQAVATLDKNGALPLEMQRRERAIHYQGFALQPLILIAELAERQGVPLYAYTANGHSIRDAVVFLGRAVDDPAIIAAYTADPQDLYSDTIDNWSWAEFYVRRFGPAGLPQSILTGIAMPTETTRLGGSTTLLAGRSRTVAAPDVPNTAKPQ